MSYNNRLDRRQFLERALGTIVATSLNRQASGSISKQLTLVAEEADIDVGAGRPWRTWAYNGQVPGPEIRVREGERIGITLQNRLPQPTSIHWHGLPVPNAMDGVAGLTQPPVAPGESFTYEFEAFPPGTYFYHSHAGLQLDRGLYGPLVVDPGFGIDGSAYGREYTLLLDDWLEIPPEEAYAQLRRAGGMGGGMMGSNEPPYAGHLLNGAISSAATALRASRGEELQLRIVNAGSATTFRVGLVGHRLVVTHADGQLVRPVEVDSIVVGMGERYDVTVKANNPGVWPFLAGPVDNVVPGIAVPLIYDGALGRITPPAVWPSALVRGVTLRYENLLAGVDGPPPGPEPARVIRMVLGTTMAGYTWTINGQAYPDADPVPLVAGENVRLVVSNPTMMRHPMHLHGHFFRLRRASGGGVAGPVKDTVLVEPVMGTAELEFTANNPGQWLFHCHHLYHMEAGMARVLEYR